MVDKAPQVVMLSYNNDVCIWQADIYIWTGVKWSASSALRKAEKWLHPADIIVTVNQGRLGVGCITRAGKFIIIIETIIPI